MSKLAVVGRTGHLGAATATRCPGHEIYIGSQAVTSAQKAASAA